MRSISRLPAMVCLAGSLAACHSDRRSAGTESADAAAGPPAAVAAAAPAPPQITITATDFKLAMPATIAAGSVALRLVNAGKELHQAQIIRLEDGKTVADLQAAMKHEGPPPAWLHFIGGPNGIAPGQDTEAFASLTPGHYAMLCLIPSADGVPHIMKGMVQPFEVTGGSGAAALPAADDTVRLVDYTFQPSRPLTSGRHTILVTNPATQPHELVLLRLAPGKTVQDFGTWATTGGMKGPPPAAPLGGVAVMESGGSGAFTVDLVPGSYGLICFVPDARDGRPHLMHGMMQQITVRGT